MEREEKFTLQPPENWMLFMFVLDVLFVGVIFIFMKGINFFKADQNTILFSIGMISFTSIFFAFIIKGIEGYLEKLKIVILKYEKGFSEDLDYINKNNPSVKKLKDHTERRKALDEYKWFVNPVRWFYLSIFIFLFSIGLAIGNLSTWVISLFLHLGLLCTLFLVTSILSLHLAYMKEEKLKIATMEKSN